NIRTGTVDHAGAVWFGNTGNSSLIVRVDGDLTGQPRLTSFDTGVAGPALPAVDDTGALWFGNGSGSPMVVRVAGNLGGIPSITRIATTVPSAGFPILDGLGNVWFGNTDSGGSTDLVRVD